VGLLGLAVILSLIMTSVGSAQVDNGVASKPDKKSYVVIMVQDPVIAYDGDIQGLPATKPGRGDKINPNSAHVKNYQKFLEKKHEEAAKGAGVSQMDMNYDYVYSLNGFQAFMTDAQVKEMYKQAGVVLVLEDVMRYADTDSAPDFLGLTAPEGPWAKGYDGENVVIGVIDTGIWPEHPSFADDGSYSAMPLLDDTIRPSCEFGNTVHNPNDAPFTCNNKLLGARQMLDT
jgi:subtilisin family serine protease